LYTYWEKRSISIVNNPTAFAVVFCRFSSFFFHRFSICCSVCSHHIPWQKYSTESVYTCLLQDSLHRLRSVTFAPEHISFFSFSPLFSFWSCVVDLADLWQLSSAIYNSLSYSIVCRCLLNSVWYACVLWCVCVVCVKGIYGGGWMVSWSTSVTLAMAHLLSVCLWLMCLMPMCVGVVCVEGIYGGGWAGKDQWPRPRLLWTCREDEASEHRHTDGCQGILTPASPVGIWSYLDETGFRNWAITRCWHWWSSRCLNTPLLPLRLCFSQELPSYH